MTSYDKKMLKNLTIYNTKPPAPKCEGFLKFYLFELIFDIE